MIGIDIYLIFNSLDETMSHYDFPPALKLQGSNESIASASLVSGS